MSKRYLRHLHEVLFALNAAVALMALVAEVAPNLMVPFSMMEVSLNGLLKIRQTDLIRGYLGFYGPSLVLATCIWGLLRVTRAGRLTNKFLFSAAGVVTLLLAPAYWLYMAHRYHWWGWYGWSAWPYGWSPFEVLLCFSCAVLYIFGKWPAPVWTAVPLIALHNIFWYLQGVGFGPYWLTAPLLGFSSAVAWVYWASACLSQAAKKNGS